jgi:hypothetical protein
MAGYDRFWMEVSPAPPSDSCCGAGTELHTSRLCKRESPKSTTLHHAGAPAMLLVLHDLHDAAATSRWEVGVMKRCCQLTTAASAMARSNTVRDACTGANTHAANKTLLLRPAISAAASGQSEASAAPDGAAEAQDPGTDADLASDTRDGDQQQQQLQQQQRLQEGSRGGSSDQEPSGADKERPRSGSEQAAGADEQHGHADATGSSMDSDGGSAAAAHAPTDVQLSGLRQELLLFLEPVPEHLAGCRWGVDPESCMAACVLANSDWLAGSKSHMHKPCSLALSAYPPCRTFYCLHGSPGPVDPEHPEQQLECGVLASGPSLRSLEQVSRAPHDHDGGYLSYWAVRFEHLSTNC